MPRSGSATQDVLIVGGGIIGISIAHALAEEGLRVRVLESETVGAGASGAAAGMLAPLSEAREAGPLLGLGLAGLARLGPLCDRLKQETGIDAELEESGLVQVAMSEEEAGRLRAQRRRLEAAVGVSSAAAPLAISGSNPAGVRSPASLKALFEWLEPEALESEEPSYSAGIVGGLRSPLECHLRPPLLLRALEKAARARGVEVEAGLRALRLLRTGDRVVGVETSAGRCEAEAVVVAAGPWTPGLLEASGVSLPAARRLPVEPVRGQILSLAEPLPATREIVWAGGVYFVPKRDGRWIVGATEEHVGFDRRVTAAGIAWILERARSVFPSLADASFEHAWAGLRPVSGDGLPFIGGVARWPGLYLAAGHGRNGVLLSAVTAERLRDEILGKGEIDPQDPFRPDRAAKGAAT